MALPQVAQWLEQRPYKTWVARSSRALGTENKKKGLRVLCTEINCTDEAEFMLWYKETGNAFTIICKQHLIWIIQTSPHTLSQVSRLEIAIKAGWIIDQA